MTIEQATQIIQRYSREGLHPDDDPREYTDAAGERSWSEAECLMIDAAVSALDFAGLDPCEVALAARA